MAVALNETPEGATATGRFARVRAGWLREDFTDRTRARAATLNQLLLGSVVFVLGILIAIGPFTGDVVMLFTGVVLVFVLTGATLVIPWNRIAFGWVALVPAVDIVAITLMQLAAPGSALGLLWIFPTTWLASGFGLLGLFAVIVAIAGIVSVLTALSEQSVTYATVLLPLVLVAVATTSHLAARRSDAQRTLLAKQARLLRVVLERTRRQEQEVTEVLDAVDFGVIRIDPAGHVAVTNEAHGRLQQAIRSEHDEGEDDAEDIPAFRDDGVTRLPADELPVERALRGEAFEGQVVWFGAEPGPRQALSVTARRLVDSSGQDAGAVVVSRDVTTELNALRARDELVASVSHELRTPLTSILGYLDLAIEDPAPAGAPQVQPRRRRAQRGAAPGHHRRHPLGVELVVIRRGVARADLDRCARDRPSLRGSTRTARSRPCHHDRHLRPRARAHVGRSAPPAPGRRQSALATRSPTTATGARSSSARRATARRAGSSCATPAWA